MTVEVIDLNNKNIKPNLGVYMILTEFSNSTDKKVVKIGVPIY